ncbi:MAG: hypothetical protein SGI89_14615 [bacterium]|nr:hypothetical protein [bacterium]
MSTALLNLRKQQILYEVSQLKLYSIVLLALFIGLIIFTADIYRDISFALSFTLSLALICLSIQSVRKDKEFIYLHSGSYHLTLFTEYFIVTFPFIVMCLFTPHWYCFFLLEIFLVMITFSKFTLRRITFFSSISKIIPVSDFEWISGFRSSFTTIIPVYLLAVGLSWIRILPLLLLWYLTMTIMSFYNECESLKFLREKAQSAGKLLLQKFFIQIRYLLIFYSPVLIINSIFNADLIIVNIFFMLSQIALLFFAVCYKYSGYYPNKHFYFNNITVIIVSMTGLIPLLMPVPAIMGIRYYIKAKKNLNQYFND